MGYKIEFNWVLKLKPEHGLPKNLQKGKVYNFKKPEEWIYPLRIPIGLCDYKNPSQFLVKVEILEFRVCKNKTEGKFKILEMKNKDNKLSTITQSLAVFLI